MSVFRGIFITNTETRGQREGKEGGREGREEGREKGRGGDRLLTQAHRLWSFLPACPPAEI